MVAKKKAQSTFSQKTVGEKFNIPKGYKGIRSNITLHLNSNLGVITGLNGSGKTTLLKYIYEQYRDKKEIFFKTQKVEYFETDKSYRRVGGRYRNYSNNPTFDDVYQEIIELFKRNNRDPYTHHHEIFSMLFDESSILYEKGYDFLEKISDTVLAEFDYPKNIKQKLGVPTTEDIEKRVIKAINDEIKTKKFTYHRQKGKDIYTLYKDKSLKVEEKQRVLDLEEKIIQLLKKEYRKKSSVKDRYSFESYLYELVSNNSFSVESIVQQLARRIYEDAKTNSSRTKTKKLRQELNDELQKYKEKKWFNYDVIGPSIFSSNYEITFRSSDDKEVHFDALSSGEKIVFELICYYFLSKSNNQNLKVIILDEFDANLNPALAEMYLSVVKEQFCEKGIITLLTTHSPSTVVEVDPKDLFSVAIENNIQTVICAKNEEGKKEILKKLAPKFVYYGEFGVLEYVLCDKNNVIILLEGKNDLENFNGLKHQYTFIHGDGVFSIKNFITCFTTIPFLIEGIKNKVVIALFDFDAAGRGSIQDILTSQHCNENDLFTKKINNKEQLFIQHPKYDNIFLAMMTPPPEHSFEYEKDTFRHQELKKEGQSGIDRQEKLIKEIIEEYKKQPQISTT